MRSVVFLLLFVCGAAVAGDGARNRVAVLKDAAAGVDAATADAVADALRRERFEVAFLSQEEACVPEALKPERFFLYVVLNLKVYPVPGTNALVRYLAGGGNLLVLGAPVFPDGLLIETLAPGYKMYPMKNITELRGAAGQGDAYGVGPAASDAVLSCYARPEGKGFECGVYKWRWIPLLRAYDNAGAERGTAAWMLLHQEPLPKDAAFADAVERLEARLIRAKGTPLREPGLTRSVVAVCAVTDAEILAGLARGGLFGDMARRIGGGLFLSHAGTGRFSYWPGETVRLGAAAVNRGTRAATARVRVRVSPEGGVGEVFSKEAEVVLGPGQPGSAAFEWMPPRTAAGRPYVVTAELSVGGKTVDTISHGFSILSAEKASRDLFVSVKDGDFWLQGRKWHPAGVNYWPRYAVACECEDFTYHWLTPGFYNPEEIEKDLSLMASMGVNILAVRANVDHDRHTLPDFLRRCEDHGMKVFLFVQSHSITDDPHYFQGVMMPFHFEEAMVADFIRATRLADNPALMGYDLIWEPAGWLFAGWERRDRWNKEWAQWIDDRYGSLANAEADWGMPARRNDAGQLITPMDKWFTEDGAWRVMVAAYRRFMDDLMSRHWNDATRKLKRLDPNHLVSFRQGNLGPAEFTLSATPKHVDFFCMEGYHFGTDVKGRNATGFINRYIHYATGGKPWFWGEFGSSVWDKEGMRPVKERVEAQRDIHDMIYRTALETGASGATPWWWPGGYRVNERSDFGIIDPDGTLRPGGELLRKYAALFRSPRACPAPDTWVTVDREAHSGGLRHVAWNEGGKAFGEAAARKSYLGIRTAGTGTTSADTPLVAVGNTPYNGKNPPKFLNAEFNAFRLKTGDGWVEVADGARVTVPEGKPVLAAASVGNLQEAAWLTPASCAGRPGAVYLAATPRSGLAFRRAVASDTPYLGDAEFGAEFVLAESVGRETAVEFQMTAEGRAWFGEKLRFTLVPR